MKDNKNLDKVKYYIRTIILLFFISFLFIIWILKVIFKKFNKYIPFIIDVDIFIKSIIIILILFTVFAFIFLPKCIYKNSEFFLDKNFLKVKSGIILPTVTLVRIKNIYKFSIKKRLIGRLFEISIVTIETSAGNIKIDFLNDKKSQFLLNNLQSIIKNYEG